MKSIIFDNLKEDVIPIFPVQKSFSFEMQAWKKNISVSREKFTATPAYSVTAQKSQERTIDKIIVDLAQPVTGKLDNEYAYVALSRTTCLKNLIILREFNYEILQRKISLFKKKENTKDKKNLKKTLTYLNEYF